MQASRAAPQWAARSFPVEVTLATEGGPDGAIVHESAFLLQTEDPGAMWRELARLK